MNNKQILKNYQKQKVSLKVKQIDLSTGKTINVFKNRYQAATWVLENKLTKYFYKSVGATRAAIAGAITNAMQNASTGNAYGYNWKLVPVDNKVKTTVHYDRLPSGFSAGTRSGFSGTPVIITKNNIKTEVPSIRAAAILMSQDANKLTNSLRRHKSVTINNVTLTKKRKSPDNDTYMKKLNQINESISVVAKNIKTNELIKFSSMSKAAKAFNVDRKRIKKSIESVTPHKNIQWKLLQKGNLS